jgi:hypothetical protein
MAGVDLVREPIEAALGPDAPAYDFREAGLVVWPDEASSAEILYLLRPEPGVPPLATIDASGAPAIAAPPLLDPTRILFSKVDITWSRWVEVWERDQTGSAPTAELVGGFDLLPAVAEDLGLSSLATETTVLADQKAVEK